MDAVHACYRLPETSRYLDGAALGWDAAKALVTRRIGSSTLGGVGEALNLVVEWEARRAPG